MPRSRIEVDLTYGDDIDPLPHLCSSLEELDDAVEEAFGPAVLASVRVHENVELTEAESVSWGQVFHLIHGLFKRSKGLGLEQMKFLRYWMQHHGFGGRNSDFFNHHVKQCFDEGDKWTEWFRVGAR